MISRLLTAMEDLVGIAEDLEDSNRPEEGERLRHLAGEIENVAYALKKEETT